MEHISYTSNGNYQYSNPEKLVMVIDLNKLTKRDIQILKTFIVKTQLYQYAEQLRNFEKKKFEI